MVLKDNRVIKVYLVKMLIKEHQVKKDNQVKMV